MVQGLILAAGASRRMRGRDKLLEEVDGVPLLTRQIDAMRGAGLPVAVALPPAPHPRHALIPDGVRALPLTESAEGMGATIAAATLALGPVPILLLLADLPEIESDDIRAILEAPRAPDEIVRGATADGRPGHPILFPAGAHRDLIALTEDDGGRGVVARHPVQLVRLPGARARLDLDTPEAWIAWRERTGR